MDQAALPSLEERRFEAEIQLRKEELALRQAELNAQLALDSREEPHCEQRVPTQIEEVVVGVDLGLQHVGPDADHRLGCRVGGP